MKFSSLAAQLSMQPVMKIPSKLRQFLLSESPTTYPGRSKRREPIDGPVGSTSIKQADDNHDEPDEDVDAIEDVVEPYRLLNTHGQYSRHGNADEKPEEVGIRLPCNITVRYRYNAVIFFTNVHKRHPIALTLGRGMGWRLWIQHLIDILPQFP